MGLMSVFLLGRLTRGEEEAGRAELVRARCRSGAHASPAASLVTVGGDERDRRCCSSPGRLIGLGLPTAGSVVFGLSFTLFGLLHGGGHPRWPRRSPRTPASSTASAAWCSAPRSLLRAIGDVGDGTISWLSPIGWAQKTRPFAGEQWWPFLVLLGATARTRVARRVAVPAPRPRRWTGATARRARARRRVARATGRARDPPPARERDRLDVRAARPRDRVRLDHRLDQRASSPTTRR